MNKKMFLFSLLTLLCVLLLAGCSNKKEIIPFDQSPENEAKIDFMEDIVQNEEKYSEMYYEFAKVTLTGIDTDKYLAFLDEIKETKGEKAEEYIARFKDNGAKYLMLQLALDDVEDEIDKDVKEIVDGYLRYTRLKDESAAKYFHLSKELQEEDPISKVRTYMEENNIVIEDIIFPETFEDVNHQLYPMRYTYRYILKGKIDGKPFEKEVVQNFYIGWDWSEKGNEHDTIEYIQDVPPPETSE